MDDFFTWIQKNKTLWTRVYDEVITPSFEEEWKKRDDRYAIELKKYKENQDILSAHINESIIKDSRLQKENEALRSQLDNLAKTNSSGKQDATVPKPTESRKASPELASTYADLSKKYGDLSQKIKYLERKNQAVMQKNREMKDSVRAWQEYVDRQAARPKSRGGTRDDAVNEPFRITSFAGLSPFMPSSPRSVATVQTTLSRIEPGRPLSTPSTPPDDTAEITDDAGSTPKASRMTASPNMPALESVVEDESIAPITLDSNCAVAECPEVQSNSVVQSVLPSSSQTTVEEGAISGKPSPYRIADHREDDDAPQFVSERSLKRKRGSQSKLNIFADHSSDGTPVNLFRVKEEQFSSPPNVQNLFRRETIDLDEVSVYALEAPRHARDMRLVARATRDALRHQRSNSAPFAQAADVQEFLTARTVECALASNARNELSADLASDIRAVSEPGVKDMAIEILQPLDTNVLAGELAEHTDKRIRQHAVSKHKGFGILSESGENLPPRKERKTRLTPRAARAKHNQRLSPRSLATSPMSPHIKREQDVTPLSLSRTEALATKPLLQRGSRDMMPPLAAHDVTPNDRPRWTMSSATKSAGISGAPRAAPSKRPPLRQRPVTDLKLADFKPNPAYNQGYTYAFSETVRNHSDRMCLPGCTNPQCCGSTFRMLAEAQGPLSSSQEAALLEDYLGAAYESASLTQMATDERRELILQARTRKLARETGKHRQAYEGRRTPPGFWRVDFPTTQEQQVDRERAKEQEKQQIHERWLEVQRRDGRWIFRDE